MSETKLSKEEALYFNPYSIGDRAGARCGTCYKFVEGGGCIEVDGKIDPDRGICGLFVFGEPRLADPGFRLRKVSQAEAGYALVGPTNCKQCEYMGNPQNMLSPCKKVAGIIHAHGCCNSFEREEGR